MDGTSNLSVESMQLDVSAGTAPDGVLVGSLVGGFVGYFDGCFDVSEVGEVMLQIPHVPGQLIITSSIMQR